jgi:hypothetical protein
LGWCFTGVSKSVSNGVSFGPQKRVNETRIFGTGSAAIT